MMTSKPPPTFSTVEPLRTEFERWRFRCPYGLWTCADGREVLFNRHYQALYERRPPDRGRAVVDHRQWVPWVKQEWFFDDGTSPVSGWRIPEGAWRPALGRINAVLRAWGLPEMPPRPRVSFTLHQERSWVG